MAPTCVSLISPFSLPAPPFSKTLRARASSSRNHYVLLLPSLPRPENPRGPSLTAPSLHTRSVGSSPPRVAWRHPVSPPIRLAIVQGRPPSPVADPSRSTMTLDLRFLTRLSYPPPPAPDPCHRRPIPTIPVRSYHIRWPRALPRSIPTPPRSLRPASFTYLLQVKLATFSTPGKAAGLLQVDPRPTSSIVDHLLAPCRLFSLCDLWMPPLSLQCSIGDNLKAFPLLHAVWRLLTCGCDPSPRPSDPSPTAPIFDPNPVWAQNRLLWYCRKKKNEKKRNWKKKIEKGDYYCCCNLPGKILYLELHEKSNKVARPSIAITNSVGDRGPQRKLTIYKHMSIW